MHRNWWKAYQRIGGNQMKKDKLFWVSKSIVSELNKVLSKERLMDKVQEECAELIQVLLRYRRYTSSEERVGKAIARLYLFLAGLTSQLGLSEQAIKQEIQRTCNKYFDAYFEAIEDEDSQDIPVCTLTAVEQEVIYRTVWKEHVKDDIQTYIDTKHNMGQYISLTDEQIEEAAARYVNGAYDCERSYWDNIEAVIKLISKATD